MRPLPLSGYPEPASEKSWLARAMVEAAVVDGAIAAAGAGDNQRLIVDLTLPSGFTYVMCGFVLSIAKDAAGTMNFGDNARLDMYNAVTGSSRTLNVNMGAFSNGIANFGSANTERKDYKPWQVYQAPLIPATHTESIYWVFDIYNETANDAAYTMNLAACFLQYDIAQSYHTALYSQQPVRM